MRCFLCNSVFRGDSSNGLIWQHLSGAQKLGQCHQEKRFYRLEHFRQHLKHSHGAMISGKLSTIERFAQFEAVVGCPMDPESLRVIKEHEEQAALPPPSSNRKCANDVNEGYSMQSPYDTKRTQPSSPYELPELTSDTAENIQLPEDPSTMNGQQPLLNAKDARMRAWLRDLPDPIENKWDMGPDADADAIVMSSWDASLLGEWSSKRDRIN